MDRSDFVLRLVDDSLELLPILQVEVFSTTILQPMKLPISYTSQDVGTSSLNGHTQQSERQG